MKSVIITALLSFTLINQGAVAASCGKYLPCGSFEGIMSSQDGMNQPVALEGITISEGAALDTLTMTGSLKELDGTLDWSYRFDMKLSPDGSFMLTNSKSGSAVGGGFCELGICSYSLKPAGGLSTSGTLAFDGTNLFRSHANREQSGQFTLYVSAMKLQK